MASDSTTPYQFVLVSSQRQKSTGVAYALFCLSFVGVAGIQHFYLRHYFRGALWFFTWGLFGVGLLYDLFATPSQVSVFNAQQARLGVINGV